MTPKKRESKWEYKYNEDRRLKNKESAKRSWEKKKEEVSILKDQLNALFEEN